MESPHNPHPAGWAPDGRLLFYQAPGDIGVLTTDGDPAVEMLLETTFDERVPALSPDGRWLAYQSNESGRAEIYVKPFPNVNDGKWQVSAAGGFDPTWSPDGRTLFYPTPSGEMMMSEVQTEPAFNPGAPAVAFALAGWPNDSAGQGRYYDLAPSDGRFLVRKINLPTASDEFTGMIVVLNWAQELLERVPVP